MTKPKLHLVPLSEVQSRPERSGFVDFIMNQEPEDFMSPSAVEFVINLALSDPTATTRQLDIADTAMYWLREVMRPRRFLFFNRRPPEQVTDNLAEHFSRLYSYALGRNYAIEAPQKISVSHLREGYRNSTGHDMDPAMVDGLTDEANRSWRPL